MATTFSRAKLKKCNKLLQKEKPSEFNSSWHLSVSHPFIVETYSMASLYTKQWGMVSWSSRVRCVLPAPFLDLWYDMWPSIESANRGCYWTVLFFVCVVLAAYQFLYHIVYIRCFWWEVPVYEEGCFICKEWTCCQMHIFMMKLLFLFIFSYRTAFVLFIFKANLHILMYLYDL